MSLLRFIAKFDELSLESESYSERDGGMAVLEAAREADPADDFLMGAWSITSLLAAALVVLSS